MVKVRSKIIRFDRFFKELFIHSGEVNLMKFLNNFKIERSDAYRRELACCVAGETRNKKGLMNPVGDGVDPEQILHRIHL